MKKNWVLIAACLGFIVAWQVFVVTPYNKKKADSLSSAPTQTLPVGNEKIATLPTENHSIPTVPTSNARKTSRNFSPDQLSQTRALELSKHRKVSVYSNGMIGNAIYQDYKVRGKGDIVVETLKQGLLWTSTDPVVDNCLGGLSLKNDNTSQLSFLNQVGNASCEVTLVPDFNKEGLLKTKLSLSGFAASAGQFVEFRAIDQVGTSKLADEHNALFVRVDSAVEKLRDKDLKTAGTLTGKIDWIAWGDKYFATVLLPEGAFNPNVVHGPTGQENEATFAAQYPLVFDGSKSMIIDLNLYFGVKDPTLLTTIHPTLYEAVDLGWMGSVARTLLWALKSIYNALNHFNLGNFGLAIIILTLIVRAAFWPLNKKVFASGQKMKALQPKIEKIKAKYAGDKSQTDQLNRETMALYKENKVNPAGSCLPLLLQMPIFIGLYGALSHSLDLYQAPFMGWIHDLSSPDRFYIFPALWTLTLLGYTFLNPQQQAQAGMPDMKWVMIAMNVFFGYLSKDWPSGLTLYLFVSNLVGISQQYMFQRAGKKLQPIQEGA